MNNDDSLKFQISDGLRHKFNVNGKGVTESIFN